MLKKILTLLSLSALCLAALAVPAKKGLWQTLLYNGSPVRAQLVGDEHMHYWQTADGLCLTESDGVFVTADMERLRARAAVRRSGVVSAQRRSPHRAFGEFNNYIGHKKGLIILVEFSDMKFLPANDSTLYTRICNEENFSYQNFRGSVYDYFKSQSYGQFMLTFDVVGPVQMPESYSHYGENDSHGDDKRPGEMVSAACMAVDSLVDFHDYDWDGDGEVDQVMCIYAGYGEADGGAKNTIWPHEWSLEESDYGSKLTLDSVSINTYAVSNERSYSGIEGIGTICHEFSHCLGLPDMYDTSYGGNYGMDSWSIMDMGSYNGGGFCPPCYTSFERLSCGWLEPEKLNRDMTVQSMMPISDRPEAYIVYNDGFEDEYYLLENRQQRGWDSELPGNGLLVIHVDYDYNVWVNNLVNTNSSIPPVTNNHQRCTPVPASGSTSRSVGITYPYNDNDSLTNTSYPAATLYNSGADGTKLLNRGILDIQRTDNGTMSFRFRNSAEDIYIPEGTILFETFNGCVGTGGNDNLWSNTMASSVLVADNDGWTFKKGYGGYRCARFGTSIAQGMATTPPFTSETGQALLTFRAAGWGTDDPTLTVSTEGDASTAKPSTVVMESFKWNTYTVTVRGEGPQRITFAAKKRFLLDDVLVQQVTADVPDAISTIPSSTQQAESFYSLDGRYLGTSAASLPRGLYIRFTPSGKSTVIRKP